MTVMRWAQAIAALAVGAMIGVAPVGSWAQPRGLAAPEGEAPFPRLHGIVDAKIRNYLSYRSDYRPAELNDLFSKHEIDLAIHFNPALSIQVTTEAEPVKFATESRAFSGDGAWMEEAYIHYDGGGWRVYGGKFTPGFGRAFDLAPGIFGTDFADDYEVSEAIGAGFVADLVDDAVWGQHAFGANLFFLDHSVLNTSLFNRPSHDALTTKRQGRVRFLDGGPGNTREPKSYVLAINGENISVLPGLSYHLSHVRLHRGSTDGGGAANRKKGYVASVDYELKLGGDVVLRPLVEHVWLRGVDEGAVSRFVDVDTGDAGDQPNFAHARYLTMALSIEHGGWALSVVRTGRTFRFSEPALNAPVDPAKNRTDSLVTASLGYTFDNGIGVSIGWARFREPPPIDPDSRPATTRILGAQVSYGFKF